MMCAWRSDGRERHGSAGARTAERNRAGAAASKAGGIHWSGEDQGKSEDLYGSFEYRSIYQRRKIHDDGKNFPER